MTVKKLQKLYEGADLSATNASLLGFRIEENCTITEISIYAESNVSGDAVFNCKLNGVDKFAGSDRPKIISGSSAGTKTGLSISADKGDKFVLALEGLVGTIDSPLALLLTIEGGAESNGNSLIELTEFSPTDAPENLPEGFTVAKLNTTNSKLHVWNGTAWLEVQMALPTVTVNDSFVGELSNLTGWFAARKVTAIADGDPITVFENFGSLSDFTTVNGVQFYRKNKFETFPAICFEDGAGRMASENLDNYIGSGNQQFSIFIVCRWKALTAASNPSYAGAENPAISANEVFGFAADVAGQLTASVYSSDGFRLASVDDAIEVNTPYLIELEQVAGTMTVKCGDLTASVGNAGNRQYQNVPLTMGGGAMYATGRAKIEIAEMIIRKQATNADDKNAIRSLFNAFYGI